MKSRTDLLLELLHASRPADQITRELAALGWDSDAELAVITKRDIGEMLMKFLKGSATGSAVQAWAEAIESRDDVGLEPGSQEILKQTLFELANPDLTRKLTPILAQKLIDDLRL